MAAMLVSRLRCMLLLALALLTRQGGCAFWPSRLPGGNVIVQALKVPIDLSCPGSGQCSHCHAIENLPSPQIYTHPAPIIYLILSHN